MEWENRQLSVGIDLHKTQFTVCALAPSGEIALEEEYPTNKEGYEEFAGWAHEVEKERNLNVSIAVEATGNARYFKNFMEAEGFDVLVINTNKFKVIVQSANKTDKRDAYTIALFLLKDFLPESHLCSQRSEELRRLLKLRKNLVEMCVQIKNSIHGMMLSYGIVTTQSQFQSQKKRKQLLIELEAQNHFNPDASKVLIRHMDILSSTEEQVKEIENDIEEYVKDDEDVENLRTIPGVGLIIASTLKAYIDDVDKFKDHKAFAAYCGLAPYVKSSNESIFIGKITKNGPKELRTALVQVVMGLLRVQAKYPTFRMFKAYEAMKRDKGSGKSIIACARRMSRMVFCMMLRKEKFDPLLMADSRYYSKTSIETA